FRRVLFRSRRPESADPPLPLDAEAVRGLALPASADLLGVRARGDRHERGVARVLAHDIAALPLSPARHRGYRPRTGHSERASSPGSVAVRPLDWATHDSALGIKERRWP